ncbi:MAG: hypothetical protein ABH862_06015 [Candidatus Omnitrophota bacterium]
MRRISIILLIAAVFLGISLKDKIAEVALERGCQFVTGVKLDIEKIELGIFRTNVKIKGMKLYNPDSYADRIMADIPEIYVDYDLGKILKGVIYLNEIKFHLAELYIIKGKDGKVNVDYLKAVKNKADGEEIEKSEKGKISDIEIKRLYLKAGKVVYKNYSGNEPIVREFNVNLDNEYENIKDPYTFIRLIISSVLRNTAIGHIVNMPMAGVENLIKGTMKTTTDTAGKILKDPGETLTKTAEGLAGMLTGVMSPKQKSSEK